MTVTDSISPIPSIDISCSRQECINIMSDLECFGLPVMKDNKLYGTVDLDECIHSQEDTIESIVDAGCASIHINSHLLDALGAMEEANSSICCVLDENFDWVGILTKNSIVDALAKSLTIEQKGAILLVEMAAHQYSSSEISRIIEGEGSQLLGLWLHNVKESGRIRATLKLNTKNAERIIGGLQRYNYEVIAAYGDDDYKENVERRYQSLMKYIDL